MRNRRESRTNVKLHLQRNSRPIFIALFISVALLVLWLWHSSGGTPPTHFVKKPHRPHTLDTQQSRPGSGKVRLDVYMEGNCPDTTNFVKTQLWPTFTILGDHMDLTIYPFGKKRIFEATCVESDGDYKCKCQHGQRECDLNQVMNCVIRARPLPKDHLPVINCLQGEASESATAKACVKDAGLDTDSVYRCATGKEGRKLMAKAGEATKALSPPLFFIPWVVIEGTRSQAGTDDLKHAICAAIKGSKPDAC